MSDCAFGRFIKLIEKARIIYGARLFLTIVAYLHKFAHGFIPGKVLSVLELLRGLTPISSSIFSQEPPYYYDYKALTKVYLEKLGDRLFKKSMTATFRWLLSKKSIIRLFSKLIKK